MSTVSKWVGCLSIAIASGLAMPVAFAQDSFGSPARQPPQPMQPAPAQQPTPNRPMQSAPASRQPEMAMPTGIANGEAQDFGVAPTRQLRPSHQTSPPVKAMCEPDTTNKWMVPVSRNSCHCSRAMPLPSATSSAISRWREAKDSRRCNR